MTKTRFVLLFILGIATLAVALALADEAHSGALDNSPGEEHA